MERLKIYQKKDIEKLISTRKGEKKFGEELIFIKNLNELENHSAQYVLLGIPEDIGIRANSGKSGASKAWNAALKALVNIQINRYNDPSKMILLGELKCEEWMQKSANIDAQDPNYFAKYGDIVKEIDETLSEIIEKIVSKGKIPVIVGGGHNNAYGNIKGTAKALKKPIDVLNIDAHTDLRQLEHRHSGNGFSYAIEGQFLCKYHIFGLHKNYTPEYIFEEMELSENISFQFMEDLLEFPDEAHRKFQTVLKEMNCSDMGLELDCDSIADFPSSAMSPVGFTVNQVRDFIRKSKKTGVCRYFHICEAAPDDKNEGQVGKALAYFISDFIQN
ncbi:formimidoylglutamase [Christiangramia fulva]|uniref:Formimidoylglutamase n=1 Tax=Christiangramia fulva TaxID=2126553 RepID=A0A2R3Z6L9_9FLAO|nr:formimidoylglutamase [Christiangramia fulva]AVR45905.1 formimidoylglutamase [Christiangramia fulva]